MADTRSDMREAPETLSEFFELCGGPAFVAKVSERRTFAVKRQGKQGRWRGARPVLAALSKEFGVKFREEWADEILPKMEVLRERRACSREREDRAA